MLFLLALAGQGAGAHAGDSTFVHVEAGGTTDVSNEQFYEDVFTDTTFLGRRLLGTPESHVAAAVSGEFGRVHAGGRWDVRARPDLVLGDKLTRASTAVTFAVRPSDAWRFSVQPAFEYERDRSFGFDRRHTRASLVARLRHPFADEENALEWRASGDLLNADGTADPYALSHRRAGGGLTWDHSPLYGWDTHVYAGADVRVFPDSSARDHVEPQVEASVRRDLAGGHSLAFAADLQRRRTLHDAASSRDRFLTGNGSAEFTIRTGDSATLLLALSGEGLWYDAPDSVVDFNYSILRARALYRHALGGSWSLAAGPGLERLAAPLSPGENYLEWAGTVELERLATAGWWLIAPGSGWRSYDSPETPGSFDPDALHSSYLFVELHVLADQPLPGRLRVRAIADGRIERHRDDAQDGRSLYFSLDVRRLF